MKRLKQLIKNLIYLTRADLEKSKQSRLIDFKKILDNRKAIEKNIREGKPISEIKSVKIAKPLSLPEPNLK